MLTLNETLDSIMELDFSSREILLEILQKRQTEERRKEIAKNGKAAKADYKSGKITTLSAAHVISALNALNK